VRFEERWLNVLAVLVQAAFYKMPVENESLGHDRSSPIMSGDHVCAENRWARVIEEFEAQSPKYNTPRSLVQAHYGGLILRSQGMVPLWSTSSPGLSGGVTGLFDCVWYLADNSSNVDYFCLLAILSSAAYAGIHMSAWNGTFPTNFELQAWRACCLFLAFGPVAAYFLGLASKYLSTVSHPQKKSAANWASKLALLVLISTLWLILLCYYYSRVFIVVESFISLRLVPLGVYWTPMWLQVIPHA
jgi:hypothetical protein